MKTLTTTGVRTGLSLALLVFCAGGAGAQTTSDTSGAPPAATGPDTATGGIENPPLSGLDSPSFEPGFGARSYLAPKIQVSEAVDTNSSGALSSRTAVRDVTRGLGSLDLQKLWKVHPLNVDYTGGVVWFQGKGGGQTYQLHSLAAIQRILWRTGQLSLRDSFSYLPQGSFGSNSYGGAGGFSGGGGLGSLGGGVTSGGGIAGGGGGGVFGGGQFGTLTNQPRITNSAIVDIAQSLSPRSSVVLGGGYALTDFLNNPQGYINSQQSTGLAGYNYQLNRHDQIAFSYAFQEIHFPHAGSGSVNVNVWQVHYGHRVSGKLDLSLSAGPQWVRAYNTIGGTSSYLSGAGQAALRYSSSARTSTSLSYSHFTNAGSGFFSGANTDAGRLALNHMLTRHWSFVTDVGYSYSTRVLKTLSSTANNSHAYNSWYAGGALRRQLGRHFGAIASYQYDNTHFGSGFCQTGTTCSSGYGRHVGLIGLDWTPSPIRLE